MTRAEVEKELRAAIKRLARARGWSKRRRELELRKALADIPWVMECQARILARRN